MEEDLKISQIEYLSNHWSDFPQVLTLSSGEQTKIKNVWNEDVLYLKMSFIWRWPVMEEDLKISKIEYLSNHWSDPPQILTLTSGEQAKIKMLEIKTIFNGIWPLMEEDLKKSKIKYLSNHRSDLP